MKTLKIPNGIVHISESKAICPYCTNKIEWDEIEDRYMKSKDGHIRKKCKCKRFIGITTDITGDLIAYELNIKLK